MADGEISNVSMKEIQTVPVGSLGLVALESCKAFGDRVNDYIVKWRSEKQSEHKDSIAFNGYERDNYILRSKISRFGSGEAKCTLYDSTRGTDLYILVDVCNYSMT